MKKYFILIALLGAFFVPGLQASAAAKPCDLQTKADALSEAKKKTDTSNQGVKSELQLRKDLLHELIGCASNETQTLGSSLRALDIKDSEVKTIRDSFVDRLADASGYYDSQDDKVNNLGLRGSKDMAKNIYIWRAGNYLPLANETANLIIWIKNQPLFEAAQNRGDQISQTVRSLKLLEEDDIKDLYNKAQDNLKKAGELNGDAKAALLADQSPDATTLEIKQSLEALSATYKSFFDLSEAVKKLLPI